MSVQFRGTTLGRVRVSALHVFMLGALMPFTCQCGEILLVFSLHQSNNCFLLLLLPSTSTVNNFEQYGRSRGYKENKTNVKQGRQTEGEREEEMEG